MIQAQEWHPAEMEGITLDGEAVGGVRIAWTTDAESRQAMVLLEALKVYAERNPRYNDNWRRFGWRGCLFRLRERVERLWDYLWDAPLREDPDSPLLDLDDAIDLINFAAFTIRAVRMDNRDGSWFGVSGPEWNKR
jgi:hypothetical protein